MTTDKLTNERVIRMRADAVELGLAWSWIEMCDAVLRLRADRQVDADQMLIVLKERDEAQAERDRLRAGVARAKELRKEWAGYQPIIKFDSPDNNGYLMYAADEILKGFEP